MVYNRQVDLNNVQVIIWDFDGTICDTYPAMIRTFSALLDDKGIRYHEERMSNEFKASISNTADAYLQGITDAEEQFRDYFNRIAVDEYPLFPGVREILETDRYVHNIVTHRGNTTYDILDYHKIRKHFDSIITREDGYPEKPSTEAYSFIISKYNKQNENILVIGDRDLDIIPARELNLLSVFFGESNALADVYFDSYWDLIESLGISD